MSHAEAEEAACLEHESDIVAMVLRAQPRDLGGFTVRRVLPSLKRRRVGSFIFFDHMGPAELPPGQGMDVRPHPHIGLSTVTYLFDGEIFHRDSLGSAQAIRPGEVNWMVAGRGITHSERTAPEARSRGQRIHGIQAWVALPGGVEESEPAFFHHEASELPTLRRDGATLRVLAGTAYGLASPVRVASPTLYVDAQLAAGARLVLDAEHEERAVYVVEGEIGCEGEPFREGDMAVLRPGRPVAIGAAAHARVMLLGGAPLDGDRHIWWNLVSSSRERIEQAKRDWREGRFPRVPGDEVEFIPLPTDRG